MLFSELYKTMVNIATFVDFRGGDRPRWIRPCYLDVLVERCEPDGIVIQTCRSERVRSVYSNGPVSFHGFKKEIL